MSKRKSTDKTGSKALTKERLVAHCGKLMGRGIVRPTAPQIVEGVCSLRNFHLVFKDVAECWALALNKDVASRICRECCGDGLYLPEAIVARAIVFGPMGNHPVN